MVEGPKIPAPPPKPDTPGLPGQPGVGAVPAAGPGRAGRAAARRARRHPAITSRQSHWFLRFAKGTARWTGRPTAFGLAFGIVIVWALLGPAFHFSDTWQLVINTGTTIVTFLMVFLIQNTQNRDSDAVQLKLDELIRAIESARNETMDLEELDEHELDLLRQSYEELADRARHELRRRK
jgi:low affinity Fe/Cu permease